MNNAGGCLSGISNWEEIRIKLAVKPKPTVSEAQNAVNGEKMEVDTLSPITRRDASLLPRIYPVCEAMVRIAILDAIIMAKGYRSVTDIDEKWDRM